MASADGYLHADEIRKLEFIFQRMGLAKTDLYDRLHSGSNTAAKMAAATTEDCSAGISIAKPVTQIDLSKLHNIRSETSVTANVLAGIFADEDSGISELISVEANTAAPESGSFEGLEHRYGALLSELRLQASWAVSDFNRLARDAGLMPGAAREAINDWAMECFDELLIEGEDLVCISLHLLPSPTTTISTSALKGILA